LANSTANQRTNNYSNSRNKKITIYRNNYKGNELDRITQLVEKVSNAQKIIRIIAYVLRFYMKTKKHKDINNTLALTTKELEWSFLKLVQNCQYTTLPTEIETIKSGGVPKPTIQGLNPFMHEYTDEILTFSLLRVGGRLMNAPIPFDAKFPLLLPKNCEFVSKYVHYLHITNFLAGARILVGLLRQRFWIINAREVVKRIVRQCVPCFKFKPKLSIS